MLGSMPSEKIISGFTQGKVCSFFKNIKLIQTCKWLKFVPWVLSPILFPAFFSFHFLVKSEEFWGVPQLAN